MGWTERNLRQLFSVSPGIFAPSAYDFANEGTLHVIYLGGTGPSGSTGVLHELYAGADAVWHDKNLLDESGGPASATPPQAYLFTLEGTQHVLYLSTADDGHVRELYWDDGWHANDLTDNTGAQQALAAASAFTFGAGRAQVVVFQGLDLHVHVLTRKSADDGDPHWVHKDLTWDHGGPQCARAPGGYSSEADGTMRVDYRGDDGRIYEYVGSPQLTWSAPVDIGTGVAGPTTLAANTFRGYASAVDGVRHLPVVDEAGDLWEYMFADASAVATGVINLTEPLGAVKVAAGTTVASYTFASTDAVAGATDHIVYTGVDQLIHELWRDATGWNENPLTGAGSPPSAVSPTGFADLVTSTQHVFYISSANEVVELAWSTGRVLEAGLGGPLRSVVEAGGAVRTSFDAGPEPA